MKEILKPLQNQKLERLDGPRPLTSQEIESLKQDRMDFHLWAIKHLSNLKPLQDPETDIER